MSHPDPLSRDALSRALTGNPKWSETVPGPSAVIRRGLLDFRAGPTLEHLAARLRGALVVPFAGAAWSLGTQNARGGVLVMVRIHGTEMPIGYGPTLGEALGMAVLAAWNLPAPTPNFDPTADPADA